MLGRYKRKYTVYTGNRNRKTFLKDYANLAAAVPSASVNFDVVSMSGKKYLSDQLLSMLSFFYNVGQPLSWIVYNDGTYDEKDIGHLTALPGVEVRSLDAALYGGAEITYPTLKKMSLLKGLKPHRPTIYTDSDILFFKSFKQHIKKYAAKNAYLVDESASYFDKDITGMVSVTDPLNLGFLLLNTVPAWKIADTYIKERIQGDALSYWTDQTACHLMVKQDNFAALPPDLFMVGGKDAFLIRHAANYKEIALRHFVGPVRHKMWQLSWKQISGAE